MNGQQTSLRDQLAIAALPAVIAATSAGQHNPCPTALEGTPWITRMAMDAYEIADAMMEARNLSPKGGSNGR